MNLPKSVRIIARRLQVIPALPYALLIAAVLLAYGNTYSGDFVFDDLVLVTGNKFLGSWDHLGTLLTSNLAHGTGSPSPFYRPLQMLIYFLLFQVFGASAPVFHFLNIVLHALNACMLYTLGIRLGFRRIAAFLAALLWAMHPAHTEVIAYISGTADPLCGALLLSGILILATGFTTQHIITASLSFFLALMTKETAVVFPLLVMGLIFYHSENRWSLKSYIKTWPFWLMTLLYLLGRETALNAHGFLLFYNTGTVAEQTLCDRVCTFLATLPAYLRVLVWPARLHFAQSFPAYKTIWAWQPLAGLAILITALTGISWKPKHSATPLAWGITWAAAMHIPQSGLLAPTEAVFLEHWLYLPTMGLFLGSGESFARLSSQIRTHWLQPALIIFALLTAGLFGAKTYEQNKTWQNSIAFFTNIILCGDDSAKTRGGLGIAYAANGEMEEAIAQFHAALALSNNNAEVHYNLGTAIINNAQIRYVNGAMTIAHINPHSSAIAEGIKHFQRAIEIDPDYYQAYSALGYVYGFHLNDHAKEMEYRAKSEAVRNRLQVN